MTEHRILSIDIQKPRVNNSAAVPGNQNPHSGVAEKPDGWKRSNNSFTFNFFPEGMPPAVREEPGKPQTAQSGGSTVGQGSGFAFNFQIPADTAGEMKSETVTPPTAPSEAAVAPGTQKDTKKENPQKETNVSQTSEAPASSKAKKKKKSGQKKKVPEGTEGPQKQVTGSTVTVASHGDDGTVLSAEQQLKRELDWCIEQLELGMRTQKGTPKQKEEASRALRTLRSSKAPLAKKRQVMRTMSGDYRKKMEEEKDKQFKLIQAAMTAAHVKTVSDTAAAAKKSVFHRKAECQRQTLPQKTATQPQSQPETLETQTLSLNANTGVQSQEDTSAFVFTPAKQEFCFNFL